MVPVIIICHLEQFLFSKLCSKVLYLEIVVKFSSQEHRHPPRIQEKKVVLTLEFQNLGVT